MKKQNKFFLKHGGFTLIELLGVILLIAILLSITMAAANHLLKASRKNKSQIMKRTLENVIMRYYEDYGEWPCSKMPDYAEYKNGKTMQQGVWIIQNVSNNESIGANPDTPWERFDKRDEGIYIDGGIVFGGDEGNSMPGGENALILEALLRDNNENGITYLDEAGFTCWEGGKLVKINKRNGVGEWAFRDVDGKFRAFKIVLRPIDKKVMVGSGRTLR